MSTRKSSWG